MVSNVTGSLLYGANMTYVAGQEETTSLAKIIIIMPCLKPTKGGSVVLRNDVQGELRHTSVARTDSWRKQVFHQDFRQTVVFAKPNPCLVVA